MAYLAQLVETDSPRPTTVEIQESLKKFFRERDHKLSKDILSNVALLCAWNGEYQPKIKTIKKTCWDGGNFSIKLTVRSGTKIEMKPNGLIVYAGSKRKFAPAETMILIRNCYGAFCSDVLGETPSFG